MGERHPTDAVRGHPIRQAGRHPARLTGHAGERAGVQHLHAGVRDEGVPLRRPGVGSAGRPDLGRGTACRCALPERHDHRPVPAHVLRRLLPDRRQRHPRAEGRQPLHEHLRGPRHDAAPAAGADRGHDPGDRAQPGASADREPRRPGPQPFTADADPPTPTADRRAGRSTRRVPAPRRHGRSELARGRPSVSPRGCGGSPGRTCSGWVPAAPGSGSRTPSSRTGARPARTAGTGTADRSSSRATA